MDKQSATVTRGLCLACVWALGRALETAGFVPRIFYLTPSLWDYGYTITIFMHKLSLGLLAIIALLSFTNCTKVIYSTQQKLADCSTQNQVLDRFGVPTEKRQEGDVTEWIYYYGSVNLSSQLSSAQVNANASSYGNSVYGSAYGSRNTNTVSTNYERYIKYTFDGNGRVRKYEWQGVDLSTRKTAVGRTILLILGCAALGVAVGIAAASGSSGD